MRTTQRADENPITARLRTLLFIYNLVFPIGILVMLPAFVVKMIRRGKYRHKFGQRFGIYSVRTRERLACGKWTWIHAVSVGESLIALKLLKEMKKRQPGLQAVLSTTTSTAFTLARKSVPEWVEVIYNPLDFPLAVHRALDLVRPVQIILVEAEVWPNLASIAKRRGIPLALVNARLSPRSERRFRQFHFVTTPIFRLLDLICVQEPEDVDKWAALGVESTRIHCTGSIKFDHAIPATARTAEFQTLLDTLRPVDAPVLLAGSTFEGEEEILARVVLELRAQFPGLFLIIAPRHVERSREIARKLDTLGIRVTLRSDAKPDAGCLIINTTGELRDWYHVATVVFIGKSLTAIGGQNPVEAISAGKPVVFGPHMENFSPLVPRLLAKNAAIQVVNADELKTQITRLFADASLRQSLVTHATEVIATHAGATARTAALVCER